jgi:phage terminase large subunit-like protein
VPAVATRRRKAKARARTARPPAKGWWGAGLPPWKRWPGVTIPLPAVWRHNRWKSADGRFFFDAEAAQRACDFFPTFLSHYRGDFAHQPFTLLPYQDQLVIRPLFGWKRAADGLRRFRLLFLAVPKGAGKSPLGAGISLYLTFCDGEEGAEVYSAASDTLQAGIVFGAAKIMVEADEELARRCEILTSSIYVPDTRSVYRVLSRAPATKHGFNTHGLVIDEFHAQQSRELYETLQRGTIKRRQPVTALLTTAGEDDESICYEEWDYARKIISGTNVDETYLPVIFEASKDDDWKDPAVWARVNPGHGITVKADAIAREAIAAANEPRKLNDFLRFHLNRWVNQATAWIPVDWWDACTEPIEQGRLGELSVFGGLDMSQKYDLTAFVLVFREFLEGPVSTLEVVHEDETNELVKREVSLNFRISLLPHFWIPADTMRERVKEDGVRYDLWAEQGLVTATEGNMIDYSRVVKDILGLAETFPRLKGSEIGYDPAFANDVALKLREAGLKTVEVPQNYRNLSEPAHVFEALVKSARVRHDGQKVLRWNIENVAVRRTDDGRIRPVKGRRPAKRIDGVVATLMGLGRALAAPDDSPFVGISFG